MEKEDFLNIMEENEFQLEKMEILDTWYLLKYTVKK